MNRRQKIIVSVTGIFLVLLILVGLTYAYFLTQITGNTNPKSISVTTADLRVVYGDGTKELLTSSTKLIPSSNAINTKDFTVTNTGDDTHYAVVMENVLVKIAGTDSFTTFESNDFRYTLTCTKKDGSSCNGVSEQTVLPMSDTILVENDIAKGDVHTYVITLWYIETNKDQSADMNKTLEARINIEDANRINPYSSNTNSLAYNIINNALNVNQEQINDGYAAYRSIPLLKVGEELEKKYVLSEILYYYEKSMTNYQDYFYTYSDTCSITSDGYYILDNPRVVKYSTGFNELKGKYITRTSGYSSESEANANAVSEKTFSSIYKVGDSTTLLTLYYGYVSTTPESIESTLSIAPDEYTKLEGKNSYYYRGSVKNNYLEFNNMCWRIVRIEGDGSIKLTLAKQDLCSTITPNDSGSALLDTVGGYGVDVNGQPDYENNNSTTSMKYLFNQWYNGTLNDGSSPRFSSNIKQKIKSTKICVGDRTNKYNAEGNIITSGDSWFYDNYARLEVNKNFTFECKENEKTTNSYSVYPLTVDEVVFAGTVIGKENSGYYLIENAESGIFVNRWMTSSIHSSTDSYVVGLSAFEFLLGSASAASTSHDVRPAISLIPGIELASNSGNGTKNNPYRVVES